MYSMLGAQWALPYMGGGHAFSRPGEGLIAWENVRWPLCTRPWAIWATAASTAGLAEAMTREKLGCNEGVSALGRERDELGVLHAFVIRGHHK